MIDTFYDEMACKLFVDQVPRPAFVHFIPLLVIIALRPTKYVQERHHPWLQYR
jgi:hypothetical protein